MYAFTVFSALLALAPPASAQDPGDFTIWPDIVLEAGAGGFTGNGIGAPSVVRDGARDRYVMVFETRLSDPDPDCPVGKWALGIAWSEEPASGWQVWPEPLLVPEAGTPWACVAANPTVLWRQEKPNELHVWFKAEQTNPPDPSIGPHRYTGVGHLKLEFRPNGDVRNVTVTEELALALPQPFGMPKVVRKGNRDLKLALTIQPDVYLATGAPPASFVLDPEPVLRVQDVDHDWVGDEFFNASLLCDSDPTFPFALFVGSKHTGPYGVLNLGALGKAVSADSDAWFVASDPLFQWMSDADWRHWDVLRIDSASGTEYAIWFSEKDASGRNRIRFASTASSVDNTQVQNNLCP